MILQACLIFIWFVKSKI